MRFIKHIPRKKAENVNQVGLVGPRVSYDMNVFINIYAYLNIYIIDSNIHTYELI